MSVRECIEAAMTRLEQHDEAEGNSPVLDEAYEFLQQAIDLLDAEQRRTP
jgi:hypothetical protein